MDQKQGLWSPHTVSRPVCAPRCQLNYVPTTRCFFLLPWKSEPPFIFQKFLHIQLVRLSYVANLQTKAFPLASTKGPGEAVSLRIHSQENSLCSNPMNTTQARFRDWGNTGWPFYAPTNPMAARSLLSLRLLRDLLELHGA